MTDGRPGAKAVRDAETDTEIADFLEGFNEPTWRGERINGVGVATGRASTAGVGCTREPRSVLRRGFLCREVLPGRETIAPGNSSLGLTLSRHEDQWGPGGNVVIKPRVVWGPAARRPVDQELNPPFPG
jgi:hypothetical protein